MKIALNIEWVGTRRGGAEKYAGALARSLSAAGHEVHLFARGVDDGEVSQAVRTHEVNIGGRPRWRWSRTYSFAAASHRVLLRQSFDLVIGFNKTWHQDVYLAVAGTGPASNRGSLLRFRNPLRRWWHALGKFISPKQRLFRRIERKQFVERAPHIVACSKLSASHFQHDHDIPPERLTVVYNGFEPHAAPTDRAAARRKFRARYEIDEQATAVLFTARNYDLKGLEPLLEAFALVAPLRPRALLVVCGSRREAKFRRLAMRLGLQNRVRFLGFVDDVAECFAACDLFAFPTFYDPCSLVVPEALHAGLPVITSAQNGAAELVDDGRTGYVVPDSWNTTAWAEALARLLDDGALRARMSAEAAKQAQTMTMEVRIEELLAVLEKLQSQRSSPPATQRRAA